MIKKGNIVRIKKLRNHNDGFPNSNHNFQIGDKAEIVEIYVNNIFLDEFLIRLRKIDGQNQFANLYENEIDFGPLTKESIKLYKSILNEEINRINKKIKEFENFEKKLEELKLEELDLETLKIYEFLDNNKTNDNYKLAKKIQSFLAKGNLPNKKGKKQKTDDLFIDEAMPEQI